MAKTNKKIVARAKKKASEIEQLLKIGFVLNPKKPTVLEGTFQYREFIAYENADGEQIYRLELQKFENNDRTTIIRKVNHWKEEKTIKYPAYDNFKTGVYDFGRLRIGDFRIFVHRESAERWIMLHVYRKTTKKTPESETLKALNRLKEYINRTK